MRQRVSRRCHYPDPASNKHMNIAATASPLKFSRYQKFVVGILAFLQFAVILDFMLMSPLGAVIMPALAISASSRARYGAGSPKPSRRCCWRES